MFDHADLDFGIYRIMNLRREEIQSFLDNELLPQVQVALGQFAAGERATFERELRDAELGATTVGRESGGHPKDP